jgi:hypothetical protein
MKRYWLAQQSLKPEVNLISILEPISAALSMEALKQMVGLRRKTCHDAKFYIYGYLNRI